METSQDDIVGLRQVGKLTGHNAQPLIAERTRGDIPKQKTSWQNAKTSMSKTFQKLISDT